MRLSMYLRVPVGVRAIILGPPGSGKGTISSRIKKDFKITCITSGDLLRKHVYQQTSIGLMAKVFMANGKLVPTHIVSEMILSEINRFRGTDLLLDGYPRTMEQAESLEEHFPTTCVLNLDVPFDEIVRRVQCRWTHIPSGRIYNEEFNPPKIKGIDDVTGEALIQREDDKPDAVKQRLFAYAALTEPLLTFYDERNVLHTFRGRFTNDLWPHVHATLAQYLKPLHYTEYK